MAEISIIGGIGIPDIYGRMVLHEDVVQQLAALPEGTTEVTVRISSPGGLVQTGDAIVDTLRASGLTIHTRGEEMVASIATVIFLAGKRRQLYPNTAFMIHNPYTGLEGDAAKLRQKAEELAAYETRMAGFYAQATGIPEAAIREMMKEAVELNGREALELGFATEIIEPIYNKVTTTLFMNFVNKLKALMGTRALFVTLANGEQVQINTDEAATDVAVGMPANLPDGETVLGDGRVLVVEAGVITNILTPADEMTEAANADTTPELVAALEAMAARIGALESTITAMRKQTGVGLSAPAPVFAAQKAASENDPMANVRLKPKVAERIEKAMARLEKYN